MKRTVFAIEMRSLRQAVEHLHLINLDELAETAREIGSESDLAFIAAVRHCLPCLPRTP